MQGFVKKPRTQRDGGRKWNLLVAPWEDESDEEAGWGNDDEKDEDWKEDQEVEEVDEEEWGEWEDWEEEEESDQQSEDEDEEDEDDSTWDEDWTEV